MRWLRAYSRISLTVIFRSGFICPRFQDRMKLRFLLQNDKAHPYSLRTSFQLRCNQGERRPLGDPGSASPFLSEDRIFVKGSTGSGTTTDKWCCPNAVRLEGRIATASVPGVWTGRREIWFRCGRCGNEEVLDQQSAQGNENAKPEPTVDARGR
jgi:hypothetical protein